jgi:hypothetical protein
MVTFCEWFGLKTTRTVFVGFTSKPVVMVSSGLASKPAAMVSAGLASKPATTVFSGLASKPVVTVFYSLASKLVATISPSVASKPMVGFLIEPKKPRRWRVSRFGPENLQLRFGDLGFKITTMVSWFWPQNQVGFGLSIAPQNQRREVGLGHASRSSGLLRVEASLARVFQSGL